MSSKLTSLTKDTFDAEVLHSDTPVFVDLGASWCGPCKSLAPIMEKLSEEADGKFKVFAVDVDEELELTKRFGVRSVPTILLFKNGKVYKQHVGLTNKENLLKMLE